MPTREIISRTCRLFMLLAVFSFWPILSWAQPACSSTENNSCDVYSDCIEANCNCGSTQFNYTSEFGLKYCKRFAAYTNFSTEGKAWRDKTLSCLKDRISAAYVSNSKNGTCNCKVIQSAAIASHTGCYIASPSFCKLPESDIRAIARIVDITDVGALGSQGYTETAKTLLGCYSTEGFDPAYKITVTFADETIGEGGDLARGHIVTVMVKGEELATEAGLTKVAKAFRDLADHYRPKLP